MSEVIAFTRPGRTAGSHRGSGALTVAPKPSQRVLADLNEQYRLTGVLLATLAEHPEKAVLHIDTVAFRPGITTLTTARLEIEAQRAQIARQIVANGGGKTSV